jgi:hypothetical protein
VIEARRVAAGSGVVPVEERDLIVRLLTTLLREDVAGLRTRGRQVRNADGERWLVLHRLWIPIRRADPALGDLVNDLAVRAAFVRHCTPGRSRGSVRARRLHAVLSVLRAELLRGLDPEPAAELSTGFRALRQEAGAALAAAGLRRRHRPLVLGRLRPELTGGAALGWTGAIGFETLAAHRDHPLYPFSLARVGLPIGQLRRVAPEHRPDLNLRWLVLPASAIEQQGRLPSWWPDADGVALPVHPAVCPGALRHALAEAGLSHLGLDRPSPEQTGRPDQFDQDRAALASGSFRPTLSLRTLAGVRYPATHLKLPLPVRTLGRLNLRTITRRGLADGALVGAVLRQVLVREPQFADDVLVADESSWLYAGDPLLAVLIRRWDAPRNPAQGLNSAAIVPVAGLAGIGPTGRLVLVALADRFADGDLDGLLQHYLRLVIGWQVRLWLRYGVVLEAHPQNVLIAVDRTPRGPRVRLLLRDLDSAKLDLTVLADSLGEPAPSLADLSDQRLAAGDPRELADLFVTTTLHQCVAAVLIDLCAALRRSPRRYLDLIRPLLAEAAARYPGSRDTALLETGIMASARLPVKRALTAATLLPKTRTGAADVNKYYGADAPSYL